MFTKNCLICGTLIHIKNRSRVERTKTCSRPCAQVWAAQHSAYRTHELARMRRHVPDQPEGYRLVPLTKGGNALVDIEDYELAMKYWWCLSESGYARRTTKGRNERLHRLIMEAVLGRGLRDDEQVDHKNGDRLDNRRDNLRVASPQENSINARRKSTLGFRGVEKSHNSKVPRFAARVMVDGQRFNVGTYDSADEAAWMYDQWAIALHGEFASLNFEYA